MVSLLSQINRAGSPAPGLALRGWFALMVLLGICVGCESQLGDLPPAVDLPPRETVIAQGQILPAGGIVQLAAAPGDVVAKRLVEVGQQVTAGKALVEMRSQQVSKAQLRTLQKRREAAAQQRSVSIAAAERQLAAAAMKVTQFEKQQAAVKRKNELLDLAQQQVTAAERILKSMESIAANAATSEFVGQFEIDRQRINVGEAQLNYRQQREIQIQAEEDLAWGLQAAEAEQAAAEDLLAATRQSQTLEVLDLEIQAATAQADAAQIVAPVDGKILAINASEGESSLPQPLVELANLEQIVCEVEINELDAALVQPGQKAAISARALGEQQLTGTVAQKFSLVGRPQLRSPDPLARVDFRTITAQINLDEASVAIARDWLQLQVEVSIDVAGPQP